MKTNSLRILILLIVAISSSSCVHYSYVPNSNNVPLFKEKNEARIQVQYSTIESGGVDIIDGFEMQSAYAVGKHTALQLNFFHAGNNEGSYGKYIEGAGGYFMPLTNRNWIFETYAGIGKGGVNSTYRGGLETAKTSITKFFIQPSFGYSRTHFSIAFSSKFAMVNIGLRSSSVSNNAAYFDYIQSFKNGKSYFWWEPATMIRGGFKNIQAFVQVTYSIHNDEALPYSNANYSLGFVVPFKIKSK